MPLADFRRGRQLRRLRLKELTSRAFQANLVGHGFGWVKLLSDVVASPMQGRLVSLDGAPLAETVVVRKWQWRGKSGKDRSTTNHNGVFSFGAVPARRGFFGFLPQQDNALVTFRVDGAADEDGFLNIWRMDLSELGETQGRPFLIECSIGEGAADGDFHVGTCRLIDEQAWGGLGHA